MAIHDAQAEVTCDGDDCATNTFIGLPATARGGYRADDRQIERELTRQGWIVRDGQHFCSEGCADLQTTTS
jgi:hypothetical protein